MALTKCPECGTEVSGKAKNCPNCGCPMEVLRPRRTVRIKLSHAKAPTGFCDDQSAEIAAKIKVLWEGDVSETVNLDIEKPASVTVKYRISLVP